ncbi:hypothetical protein [Clostridium magnum]|uniref:Uncharacterized protein n=1 Tax=Clostridium magnum DSM 2767 TaxID=1121326 RepID=A0A162U7B6_9CLOT|nr:hypothetical protein [Clostridium magnum]KZL93614.1 hypothetical protein CLMAG_06600 [Clostridium magnum DSM 2767]SHI57779.1 hypothetical protein SAMN02745944_04517 [Clostridium magnum DSM 2767]
MRKPFIPMQPRKSQYGVPPEFVTKRMADYPEMTSLLLKELFPDTPDVIFPSDKGIEAVKEAAEKVLENIDMSKIKSEDSVNICASHHGFTLLGGEPYAELIRTVRDVIERKTGTKNIRLRAGVGLRFRETEEYIKSFGLDKYFQGKVKGVAPIDEGIAIETEIGTLYGIKAIYDADWVVHVHNSDVREVHFHRQVDRAVKPFGMSYARIETRSTYHQNLGPRGANFTARCIFNSDFVQSKFAFAAFLNMSPAGVVNVDADNNLFALNDRLTVEGLKYYGKIMTLLGEIDECIIGLDFPCPVPYVFAAGVIYANVVGANGDLFDLDECPMPPYTWYTEAAYGRNGKPLLDSIPPINSAIKMVVHNYAWGGYPSAFFAAHTPTIVVGREQADLMNKDSQNLTYMEHAVIADSLDTAMKFAYNVTKTDKVLIFDGAGAGLNVSSSLAELLKEKAPVVSKRVDEELLPKWLKQRGIDPNRVK